MNVTKGRYWGFVVYPDSLPNNYIDLINSIGIPMCFSPLHDKDINPDGSIKKPHYHVLCYYDNVTSYNNVNNNVCKLLNGTIPIKIENLRSMYRYHIHLDNPEKFQYDDKDRIFFNGFDTSKVEILSKTDLLKLKRSILEIIEEKSIYEYSDLINFLNNNDLIDLLDIASGNTVFFNAYIHSKRNKFKDTMRAFESSLIDLEDNHKNYR